MGHQAVSAGGRIDRDLWVFSDFDLPLCVTSGQVFRWVEDGGRWVGVDGEHRYEVTVRPQALVVSTNGAEPDFRSLFRLDLDSEKLRYELLLRGPELEPLVDSLAGLRLMRPSCPTETFFSFLCTANNHIARISPMVRKLAAFGEDRVGFCRFPTVEVVAGIDPRQLRDSGFGYRAETIVRAAQEVLSRGGDAYLSGLKAQPYDFAEAELRSIPSVGRKLADCIALYALDKTDAVPLDTHVWQAVTRVYFPHWQGESLTDLRYRTAADHLRDRFGDLAAHAQQLLFCDNMRNWRSRR